MTRESLFATAHLKPTDHSVARRRVRTKGGNMFRNLFRNAPLLLLGLASAAMAQVVVGTYCVYGSHARNHLLIDCTSDSDCETKLTDHVCTYHPSDCPRKGTASSSSSGGGGILFTMGPKATEGVWTIGSAAGGAAWGGNKTDVRGKELKPPSGWGAATYGGAGLAMSALINRKNGNSSYLGAVSTAAIGGLVSDIGISELKKEKKGDVPEAKFKPTVAAVAVGTITLLEVISGAAEFRTPVRLRRVFAHLQPIFGARDVGVVIAW
jgi:hypothetical protein